MNTNAARDMNNPLLRAAENIRRELAANFPGVKFSVKSKSFSMGDDISVSWTDGPTTKEVDAIIDKYQYGEFDGMTDSYDQNQGHDWLIGGTKFVMTSRNISDETAARELAKEGYGFKHGNEYYYGYALFDKAGNKIENSIAHDLYNALYQKSYSEPAVNASVSLVRDPYTGHNESLNTRGKNRPAKPEPKPEEKPVAGVDRDEANRNSMPSLLMNIVNPKEATASKKSVIKIGRSGDKWRVYDAGNDKTLGEHDTYREAREQQKAVYQSMEAKAMKVQQFYVVFYPGARSNRSDVYTGKPTSLKDLQQMFVGGLQAEGIFGVYTEAAEAQQAADDLMSAKPNMPKQAAKETKNETIELGMGDKIHVSNRGERGIQITWECGFGKNKGQIIDIAMGNLSDEEVKAIVKTAKSALYESQHLRGDQKLDDVRKQIRYIKQKYDVTAAKKPSGPDSVYKPNGYDTETFEKIGKEFAAFVKKHGIVNPGRRDFKIWMDYNYPDITPTNELREVVMRHLWGKEPEVQDTTGNDKGKGVEKEKEMAAEAAGAMIPIGDGFYVSKIGYDDNGNWSIWISKGAGGRARKIQTNANGLWTANDQSRGKGSLTQRVEMLSDAARNELKEYWRKYIEKSAAKVNADAADGDDLLHACEYAEAQIAGDPDFEKMGSNIKAALKVLRRAINKAKPGTFNSVGMKANADAADGDAPAEDMLPLDEASTDEIIRYIENTPEINDEMFHDFIDGLGVDIHEAESFVYQAFRNMLTEEKGEGENEEQIAEGDDERYPA